LELDRAQNYGDVDDDVVNVCNGYRHLNLKLHDKQVVDEDMKKEEERFPLVVMRLLKSQTRILINILI
jgi:hypothetical protein